MTSMWLAGEPKHLFIPLTATDDPVTDIVVAGAGITGLITAVLLARAGKQVLVLEAHNTIGAGASVNTTAKISLLQGAKLSKITAKHGSALARQYVDGNREGQAWVLRHCETHSLDRRRVISLVRPSRVICPGGVIRRTVRYGARRPQHSARKHTERKPAHHGHRI